MRIVLAATLVVLGGLGCATSRTGLDLPQPAGFPNHSVDEILSHLPTPDSLWRSFSGDLAIAYSVPGDRGTLNASVSYRRADSVLIRFKAPLGVEVSRALVPQDSLYIYDRVDRKLYYGRREVAESLLPVGFWRADVAAAVFGYDDLRGTPWTRSVEGDWYVLTSEAEGRTVIIDPSTWRIIASDWRNRQGMIVDQRRFTEFDEIDGRYIPRRIVTAKPDQDVRASISIRRLRPEPENLSFDLGLRSDVERIPVH